MNGGGGGADDQGGELDSDDDSDAQSDAALEEPETDNVILCQYDKVSRIKHKWKASLRDGLCRIGGRDYLFSKGAGDFVFGKSQ